MDQVVCGPSFIERLLQSIQDKLRLLRSGCLPADDLVGEGTERYFVSESSVYRILKEHDLITSPAYIVLKAANEFKDKTTRPNQLWQTDFTYLKVIGWGWFYLSTILDGYSRYIIAWKLCTTMKTTDVIDTLNLALQASGCDQAAVLHKPRLLSDNGSSYISGELADWLEDQQMDHVRGAPYQPQTQGKIERWHQTLKNRILLENYYLPGDLRHQIDAFVEHYNHHRYHESLQNLTPADVYFCRGQAILKQRERTKRKTIETRRLLHRKSAALSNQPDGQDTLPAQPALKPKTSGDGLAFYHKLSCARPNTKKDMKQTSKRVPRRRLYKVGLVATRHTSAR